MGNTIPTTERLPLCFRNLKLVLTRTERLGNLVKQHQILNQHCLHNVYASVFLSESHITCLALGFVLDKKKKMGGGEWKNEVAFNKRP